MTWALAPPCRLPERAPTPAATPAYIWARVETTSRQAKVEALKEWSAWSTRMVSRSRAISASGSLPVSCHRKLPAWERASSAAGVRCPRVSSASRPRSRARGDEPDGLGHVGLSRFIVKVRVRHGQDRDCCLEHVHGVGLFRQLLQRIEDELGDLPRFDETVP